jgi:hypothetical protein
MPCERGPGLDHGLEALGRHQVAQLGVLVDGTRGHLVGHLADEGSLSTPSSAARMNNADSWDIASFAASVVGPSCGAT